MADPATELGLGRDELALITGRARSKEPGAREWDRLFERLAGLTGLTRRRATFTRDEVLQALCETLPPGARVDRASLDAAADRFLASDHVIGLVADGRARVRRSVVVTGVCCRSTGSSCATPRARTSSSSRS